MGDASSPLSDAPFLDPVPSTPQMSASRPRRWMSRGGRTWPTSICAGWRRPSGERRGAPSPAPLPCPRRLPPERARRAGPVLRGRES